MSIKDLEDKRLEDQRRDKGLIQLKSEQKSNEPDNQLLLGTVQFYEDIFNSLNKTIIVVYNHTGKHIEVWGSSGLKDIYGFAPQDFKGKTLDNVFPEPIAVQF
ncbi:MAG: PAS domain-containing protein, partial [Bacteroidales bacterium]|nr:PAS domain-containing protein [Bacteroidales bacterium]